MIRNLKSLISRRRTEWASPRSSRITGSIGLMAVMRKKTKMPRKLRKLKRSRYSRKKSLLIKGSWLLTRTPSRSRSTSRSLTSWPPSNKP